MLGLLHEQCRPDRDDHIQILWENIDPRKFVDVQIVVSVCILSQFCVAGFLGNFKKGEFWAVETFDLPYDYESLMHYPGNAFALNGRNVTIVSRVSRFDNSDKN